VTSAADDPGLMVLIIIAMMVSRSLTVNQMALVVASLAWLVPARTIRAQVLTLRERSYVQVAQLSACRGVDHLQGGSCPTCCPTWAPRWWSPSPRRPGVHRVGGPRAGADGCPTIGMTLFWISYNAAVINAGGGRGCPRSSSSASSSSASSSSPRAWMKWRIRGSGEGVMADRLSKTLQPISGVQDSGNGDKPDVLRWKT